MNTSEKALDEALINYGSQVFNYGDASSRRLLHADLQEYVRRFDMSWAVMHPLIYELPPMGHPEAVNARYEQVQAMLAEAEAAQDWHKYVDLHQRPYRVDAFLSIAGKLNPQDYWKLLRYVWIDSENIFQAKTRWRVLLSDTRPRKEHFMTEEERKALAKLPEQLTVFRGGTRGQNLRGLSWTLDRKIAAYFATRFSDRGVVIERRVRKNEVFAYLMERKESEVIILPRRTRRKEV